MMFIEAHTTHAKQQLFIPLNLCARFIVLWFIE